MGCLSRLRLPVNLGDRLGWVVRRDVELRLRLQRRAGSPQNCLDRLE